MFAGFPNAPDNKLGRGIELVAGQRAVKTAAGSKRTEKEVVKGGVIDHGRTRGRSRGWNGHERSEG
jgi:hypothetical protein